MVLPSIGDHKEERPGEYAGSCNHFIPKQGDESFWDSFYEQFRKEVSIQFPIERGESGINPLFGYFGFRYNRPQKRENYFHVGLDISAKAKTPVRALCDGVLEYSGFGLVNGRYIMLSHPHIKTEDGYTFFSLYMHLRDGKIGFTSYQKMLREISFNTYPVISVGTDTVLGTVGQTGFADGHPHVHVQCEFRNEKGDIVLIDPARISGIGSKENLTSGLNDTQYADFVLKHKALFKKWHIGIS